MRIRTDGEYAHRADTIEEAAFAWGCNKTRAVLLSCELATFVLEDLEALLEDERLPPDVREELLTALDRRSYLRTDYRGPDVSIDSNG